MSRPWTAYALRILSCGLLFVTGYTLLASSTFAARMRQDWPSTAMALVLAAILSLLPLIFAKRFLRTLLLSGFLLSGIGAYWWTTIPWDEFIKDSGFTTTTPPTLMDYLLVAGPTLIAAFYATASRASTLMADLKNRGADANEIQRAAGTSFLSGAALLILATALGGTLWLLMATRVLLPTTLPIPTGLPAIMISAALVATSYAIIAKRFPTFPARTPAPASADAPTARAKARRTSG